MKTQPTISVIIPCYNQGDFLEETCNSIKSQTFDDWEALIVNDGSTDHTKEVATNICKTDSRFKYVEKENGGLSSARNHGLNLAKGEYIQFLDSDDLLSPKKFQVSLETKADLIITNFEMLEKGKVEPPFCDLNNRIFDYESVLLNWDRQFAIPIHCGLFKTSVIKDLRFNEDLKAKEDWLFWLEFLKKSSNVIYIEEPLLWYRIHEKNMTLDNNHMISNKKEVYGLIYSSLNQNLKEKFFIRTNDEYHKTQIDVDYNLNRYRKEKKKKRLLSYSTAILLTCIILLLVTR